MSNLGLTYLAHPRADDLSTRGDPAAPNGTAAPTVRSTSPDLAQPVAFGAVIPGASRAFERGCARTDRTLTGLRVQNCVMLQGAAGFDAQSNQNKVLQSPFAAVRSADGRRWIITAWERGQRTWANPPVPCIHADPQFPDCAPGETHRLRGWLWFYQREDIQSELRRLESRIRADHE